MTDLVLYDVKDSVASIIINRPEKRNALDKSTREELRAAFKTAEADDDVRVIILRGAGSAFSAGGDLEFYSNLGLVDGLEFIQNHVEGLYTYIEQVSKPTIAAVDGHALGGGTEISLSCDIRLASPEAKFGTTETKVGLYPAGGAVQRLIQIVGLGRAKHLIYSGDIINAERGKEIGLVNEVYQKDEFEEKVEDYAEQLASRPPIALSLAKESMHRGMNMEPGLGIDRVAGGLLFGLDDQKEGARAFLENREPEFLGR